MLPIVLGHTSKNGFNKLEVIDLAPFMLQRVAPKVHLSEIFFETGTILETRCSEMVPEKSKRWSARVSPREKVGSAILRLIFLHDLVRMLSAG
jgi:hypothetical protein